MPAALAGPVLSAKLAEGIGPFIYLKLYSEPEKKLVSPIDKLLGKQIIVYTSLATYRGILKEISEEGISLRGRTSWHEIPMDGIKEIRPLNR